MDREADPNSAISARRCGALRCACAPCLIGCAVGPGRCCWSPCRSPAPHPSWPWAFEAAVASLRSAAANLPRAYGPLRLITDPPLGIVPAWLGARGVGCAPNTAAPSGGEWFWPAEGHAASCWCCCPAYPGNPELPLEAAYATSNSNPIYGPSSSSSPPVQAGGGSSSGPTSSSGGDRRSLQVSCYDRVVLYLHGGAFALCSSKTHRVLIMSLVSKAGACVLCPDYRRPPEHPWPLPVGDCLAAYVGHVIITYTSPGLVV